MKELVSNNVVPLMGRSKNTMPKLNGYPESLIDVFTNIHVQNQFITAIIITTATA